MNTLLLKKSREVLKLVLREVHDDIDSNTKSEVEMLIEQIGDELEGNTPSNISNREILETFGIILGVVQTGAELVEMMLPFFDS